MEQVTPTPTDLVIHPRDNIFHDLACDRSWLGRRRVDAAGAVSIGGLGEGRDSA